MIYDWISLKNLNLNHTTDLFSSQHLILFNAISSLCHLHLSDLVWISWRVTKRLKRYPSQLQIVCDCAHITCWEEWSNSNDVISINSFLCRVAALSTFRFITVNFLLQQSRGFRFCLKPDLEDTNSYYQKLQLDEIELWE